MAVRERKKRVGENSLSNLLGGNDPRKIEGAKKYWEKIRLGKKKRGPSKWAFEQAGTVCGFGPADELAGEMGISSQEAYKIWGHVSKVVMSRLTRGFPVGFPNGPILWVYNGRVLPEVLARRNQKRTGKVGVRDTSVSVKVRVNRSIRGRFQDVPCRGTWKDQLEEERRKMRLRTPSYRGTKRVQAGKNIYLKILLELGLWNGDDD